MLLTLLLELHVPEVGGLVKSLAFLRLFVGGVHLRAVLPHLLAYYWVVGPNEIERLGIVLNNVLRLRRLLLLLGLRRVERVALRLQERLPVLHLIEVPLLRGRVRNLVR